MLTSVTSDFYLDPNIKVQPISGNYMSLYDFTTKFYPSLKDRIIDQYGNQTIRGFLDKYAQKEMISADTQFFGMTGRRRKLLEGVTRAGDVFTIAAHTIRPNENFMVIDKAGKKVNYGICVPDDYDAGKFTAKTYDGADWTVGTTGLTIMAAGYEFQKGTPGMTRALTREVEIGSTSLIIGKDMFEINGSDMCDATWLKTPDGNAFWTSAEIEEARERMLDQMEIQAFVGKKAVDASDAKTAGFRGIEGVFDQIRNGGNSFEGNITGTADIESIIKRLDKVNGETYNLLYLSTEASLSIDNWLAKVGGAGSATWGYFDNKQRMLDFGFDAFKMGGYEFYKTTWKLLKDPTVLNPDNFAAENQIHGIMVPLGRASITTGYNGDLSGQNSTINAPYLTKLYKGMPGYSRELVTTFHGSQNVPDATNTWDVFGIDWLSEWGLRCVGLKKWAIFEGVSA
jgi:hypothetical protein|nr:MAG TPA: Structural protein [Crassvirales sp.]